MQFKSLPLFPGSRAKKLAHKHCCCLSLTDTEAVAWGHSSKPVFTEQISPLLLGTQQAFSLEEKLEWRLEIGTRPGNSNRK